MIPAFINQIAPFWHSKNVKTSSIVFRLVTKYTVNLLILFIVLICSTQLFGHNIQCFSSDKVFLRALELKCWIEGVFLDEKMIEAEIGKGEAVHYGVGSRGRSEPNYLRFKFYQWIVPLLLLQTLCLFIPRAFWHIKEKGTMAKLLDGVSSPVITENWEKQRKQLISYVKDVRKKYHQQYAMMYLLCEFLSVIVILVNMLIMNIVVNNFWTEYKPAVTSLFAGNITQFNRDAARLFPTQAKCDFKSFGPSGSIQIFDALCILPQNVINEKIFAVLYVWYIFLLFCAILNLVYLLVIYSFKTLRLYYIGAMIGRQNVTMGECKSISEKGDYGLWFTLSVYYENMTPVYFQDLCKELKSGLKPARSFESFDP